MTEQKTNSKALMWTILLISLIQMPQFALLPATNLIATDVFPEMGLPLVQTIMSLPGIVAVFAGVASALLIRYGLASKKSMTVFGLAMIVVTGVVALVLHTRFWQLCLMNACVGIGMGTFVPSTQSIMFDNFDEKTRQFISGVSFSCINIGGLLMSLMCGFLITFIWYGGHLQMLIALPVVIVALLVIPKDRKMRDVYTSADADTSAEVGASDDAGTETNAGANADADSSGRGRTKLPGKVLYYTFLIVIFMIMYNVATVNISTHLANGGVGDSSTAGFATAFLMVGGVAAGLIFPKLSQILRDNLFALAFIIMAIGFMLMYFFPASLVITLVAMFLCGSTMSLLVPRCIFNVSNLTDPTNSATATMLVCCVAPGSGHFLSPVIMTNLTLVFGGESTRYRFMFTAYVCLGLAVILDLYKIFTDSKAQKTEKS